VQAICVAQPPGVFAEAAASERLLTLCRNTCRRFRTGFAVALSSGTSPV